MYLDKVTFKNKWGGITVSGIFRKNKYDMTILDFMQCLHIAEKQIMMTFNELICSDMK
jgi:hypothetical protein